ncbi:MAG: EboA family metabolite traffic protein [Cyanobacteria bacterium P01_F01_bin.86]
MLASVSSSTNAALNLDSVSQRLHSWLTAKISDNTAGHWLEQTLLMLRQQPSETTLFSRFSTASRKVGKADLSLTAQDATTAHQLFPGWSPIHWSTDQAARTLMLLAFPASDAERYVAALEKLFSAADVAEQVALYQSLPLLPHPECWRARAIEGLRSNITAVFNAIALNNPYPAAYFDEAAWNQMVLKALFVDSRLSQIQGLEVRANATLARMLSDYAHERWAAGRTVNPQLWRSLGPFAQGDLRDDLARVIASEQPFEQEAAALACASATAPETLALLDQVPTIKQQIAAGQLTWDSFSTTHL